MQNAVKENIHKLTLLTVSSTYDLRWTQKLFPFFSLYHVKL